MTAPLSLAVRVLIVGQLGALPLPSPALDLQLGGSFREQVEHVSDDSLGTGGSGDTVAQHRLLVNFDLQPRLDLRAFVELGAYGQNGRNGGSSPVDASDPDLHQGYVEWRPSDGAVQLAAGRREWTLGSGRLVSMRDGPNIRRAFDGARLDARLGDGAIRALWGRPVDNRDGAFDDHTDEGQRLAGVQLEWQPASGLTAELYGLDYARDAARFATGAGEEDRRSWGVRLYGTAGPVKLNTEAVWQTGDWRGERICAWTLANDFGWQLEGVAGTPRLGLKADLASGDSDPADGRLETFNALYPNPSYFSDAALIAPANLIDVQPNVSVSLAPDLDLYLGWNLLWKHRRADAVYTTPVPLTPVAGSPGREGAIGQQLQLSGQWTGGQHLRVEASYVRFEPGDALSGLQDRAIDFLQLVFTLSY